MNDRVKEIYGAFDGRLVGSKIMKIYVCETLAKMPDKIVNFVTENCWFMGSMEDAWGFTFTGNDLKEQHLVFLSDDLFREDDEQIHRSIAHEIGHAVLRHRNSTLFKQTKREIRKQEKEADKFARKYTQ